MKKGGIRAPSETPTKPSQGQTANVASVANESASVIGQLLDQMESCFQTNHEDRRQRIRQLERRQQELEKICNEQSQASNSQQLLADEFERVSAACNTSITCLLDECRVATEETQRLRHTNEQLMLELKRKDDHISKLDEKVEKLARNVVRALKDRNAMEEDLATASAMLHELKQRSDELSHCEFQRNEAIGKLEELQLANHRRSNDAEMAALEVKRLQLQLEKSESDSRRMLKETQDEDDREVSALSKKLLSITDERDNVVNALATAHSKNAQLASEVERMQRALSQAEHALQIEASNTMEEHRRRDELERRLTDIYQQPVSLHSRAPQNTSQFPENCTGALVHPQEQSDYESITAAFSEAVARCFEHQHRISALQKELDDLRHERMLDDQLVDSVRRRLLQIQTDAVNVSAAIRTCKADCEQAVANANSDLVLSYAQQVERDFTAMADFLARLREMQIEGSPGAYSPTHSEDHAMRFQKHNDVDVMPMASDSPPAVHQVSATTTPQAAPRGWNTISAEMPSVFTVHHHQTPFISGIHRSQAPQHLELHANESSTQHHVQNRGRSNRKNISPEF